MVTRTHMVHLSLFIHFGCSLLTMATQCDDLCDYQRFIRDAYCHEKNLTRIPSGCEGATTLHLGNNKIFIDEDTFTGFNRLQYLYFRQNGIDGLVAGTFQPIAATIRTLDLTRNRIQELENNTFVNMTKLQQLILTNNRITIIAQEAFQNLRRLYLVDLRDNLIEYLPSSVFDDMPLLRQLRLQNNKILNFNSRILLNLNSLAHLFLDSNNITHLTGQPLHASMQLQNINLSLNHIEQFDCQWSNALPSLISIDLSRNSIHSISNCKSHLGILKLTDNPFDCSCTNIIVASWYQGNPNSTSPICHSPPGKQGQKLRDISFDECFTTGSPTVSITSKLHTITQAFHPKTLKESPHEHTTTEKMVVNFPTQGIGGLAAPQDKLLDNILYYIICGFVILTVIVVILIIVVLVRQHRHSRKLKVASHYTTFISNNSNGSRSVTSHRHISHNQDGGSDTSRQQGGDSNVTRIGSHLYATIPGDRSTGEFATRAVHIEPGLRDERNSSNRQLHAVRQSDRSPSHRQSNARQESDIVIDFSGSQDSGLPDYGVNRDSVTEWLMLHAGLHYIQISDDPRNEMSSSEYEADETERPSHHPVPPRRIPQNDHWIQPEMVTLLNSPNQQSASFHKGQSNDFKGNSTASHSKTCRLQPSKKRPSSGTYIPHHTVH